MNMTSRFFLWLVTAVAIIECFWCLFLCHRYFYIGVIGISFDLQKVKFFI